MEINYKGKDVEIKFNYQSFKHMGDIDFGELEDLDRKPFKMFQVTAQLLYGALKSSKKRNVTMDDIDKILEDYTESDDKSVPELFSELMKELENSGFFKSLQKLQEKE